MPWEGTHPRLRSILVEKITHNCNKTEEGGGDEGGKRREEKGRGRGAGGPANKKPEGVARQGMKDSTLRNITRVRSLTCDWQEQTLQHTRSSALESLQSVVSHVYK